MKCIIADDEHLVRYSIQDMLEEIADAGLAWFDEISQAVNGEDLLQQLQIRQPELVFVDIRMPLLNGLDAIEKGKNISPHTQWIILTGYAEFDYAKRAISLGALDYLLKPASKADVERVVILALSKVADKRAQDQLFLEHRVLGLLQNTFSEDSALPSDTAYAGFVLSLDSCLPLKAANAFQKLVMQNLRHWLRTSLPSTCNGSVVVLDDGNMICMVAATGNGEPEECLRKAAHHALATSGAEGSGGAIGTVLQSRSRTASLTDLLQDLGLVSKESCIRILDGLGQIIDGSRRDSLADSFNQVRSLLFHLDRAVRNRELEPEEAVQVFRRNRSQLESIWRTSKLCKFLEIHSGLDLCQPEPGRALDACLAWIARGLLAGSSVNETARRRQLVQRALEILAEQFTREIGLAQVADLMGITPNYLSTEFNRTLGESFSQYVTRLRMKKADELLGQGNLTVKEVAARVGYVSSRHFAVLFKKHFGHVPSEHIRS